MLSWYLRSIVRIIFFTKNKFKKIESRIGYIFKNKNILEEALTHKSLDTSTNYERLEFLGDSTLNIIISEWLYEKYPNYNEGLLTKARSDLVNKDFLVSIAKKILFQEDLMIGNSIKKNNQKAIMNIYSDIFESILGAIFIDGGIKNAKKFIYKHLLLNLDESKIINKNYKGMLIEKCHALKYPNPVFKLINKKLENLSNFEVELTINNISYKGFGDTKKNAEANASKAALEGLIIR